MEFIIYIAKTLSPLVICLLLGWLIGLQYNGRGPEYGVVGILMLGGAVAIGAILSLVAAWWFFPGGK